MEGKSEPLYDNLLFPVLHMSEVIVWIRVY